MDDVGDDEPMCVFCLQPDKPLLQQICQCRASIGFIHAACIEKNLHYHPPVCGICKQPYHLNISDTTTITDSKLKQWWAVFCLSTFKEMIHPVHMPLYVTAVVLLLVLCVWAVQGHVLKAFLPITESLELALVLELYNRFGDSPERTLLFSILFVFAFFARKQLQRAKISFPSIYIGLALLFACTFQLGWLSPFILSCIENRFYERPWPRMLGYYIPHAALILVSLLLVLKSALFPLFLTTTPTTWLEISVFSARLLQAGHHVWKEQGFNQMNKQLEEALSERNVCIQPVDDALGVRMTRNNQGWIVTHVSDNSLAQKAGVLVGDQLQNVNGEPMEDMTLQQWSARNHQAGDFWHVMRDDNMIEIIL